MTSSPCYCTALKAASRRLAALYDEALKPVGVNIAQFSLLRRVRRAETVTLTELGRLAELDRSTIGRNVRVLERMGLVALSRGEDQREAVVRLTPAGHQALVDGDPLWDGVQDAIDARLGPTGVLELFTTLRDF
ncbi:MarR family winged helix-turn-helix transcriptional regulator [Roseococcus pinisoli]|uniref:Winged helix DNA-binding protein n=1 Tax=Roseococcus pinisoli TaxID=2835040 RepID=A0ABS5QFD4_9PROT|nr:MarR family transcriptional regulator [Roseococcus pinisoli]MBS7812412.1 winged helix DNA-binding protein [Roseococcus pinisoli]